MLEKLKNRKSYFSQKPSESESVNLIYEFFEPKAKGIKIILQMLIGLTIIILIITKIVLFINNTSNCGCVFSDRLVKYNFLDITGKALAISACIELAFMLFTPGPDEAIDPLILGLSSAALIMAADEKYYNNAGSSSILLFVICIGFLFWIKNRFF